jgi:histidine phosphotransfer protein HptB
MVAIDVGGSMNNALSTEVCDRAILEELREEGNVLLIELVGLFQEELNQSLPELARALAAADYSAVARIAHTLKGSAATFGAEHLQQLAAEINQAASGAALDRVSELLPEMLSECEKVRRCLIEASKPNDRSY